jgi:hypothetical protein
LLAHRNQPPVRQAASGQIVVLADWLQHKDLKKALIDPALEHNSIAQLAVALSGLPGVFRPAYLQAIRRWWTPSPAKETPLGSLFDRLLPAQVYVPTRDPADFANMADVFNACEDMGIVFNAYNFTTAKRSSLATTRPISYGRKLNRSKTRLPPPAFARVPLRGRSSGSKRSRRKPFSQPFGYRYTALTRRDVAATNNESERALRPSVIFRK